MQPLGDCFRVRIQISRGIAQQQRRKRGVIIDDDPAFAIEDFAARRQNRHIANAVLLRQLRVLAALHHLQPPQPVCQKQENKQYDILHGSEPERGNFFFAAEHQSSVPASRHRRPSLKSAIPMGLESTGNVASILTCSPSCRNIATETKVFDSNAGSYKWSDGRLARPAGGIRSQSVGHVRPWIELVTPWGNNRDKTYVLLTSS